MERLRPPRDLVVQRLDLGKSKYGHGVRVNSDTMTWGTHKNSWLEMAIEEFLDGMIYIIADYIREGRNSKRIVSDIEYKFMCKETGRFSESPDPEKWLEEHEGNDDNELIMFVLDHYKEIESERHKLLLESLINTTNFCL